MPTPAAIAFDNSGSMGTRDVAGSDRSRWDNGLVVLNDVVAQFPDTRIVLFASTVTELRGFEPGKLGIPPPMGGTMLRDCLDYIADGPKPSRLVIISDGLPNDEPGEVFKAARRMAPLVIDTFFVGADGDRAAASFMRTLSLMGGRKGVSGIRSLNEPQKLAREIAGLIGGPRR
jgi:hypothetical protein